MKLVYIAGAITSTTSYGMKRNLIHAELAAVKLMKRGYSVICPHKNTENLGGIFSRNLDKDFQKWMERDLEILSRCDKVYMLKGWRSSRGAKIEYQKAKELGLEILFEEDEKRSLG